MGGHFDLDNKNLKISELEQKLQEEGIWSDPTKANQINNELTNLKKIVNKFNELKSNIASSLDLLSILNDNDINEVNELEENFNNIKYDYEKLETEMLLNGKYDNLSCYLEIHPGAGGTEACDWASMLLRMYEMFCDKNNYTYEELDFQKGEEAGIKSVTIKISGDHAYGYFKGEQGVHRLVRISPFDSNARRHTSFAAVTVIPELEQTTNVTINPDDIRVDVYRSSGKGGQGVNTTDSAVRITHIPTGIVVTCQNERSQIKNKERAMVVLKSKIYDQAQQKQDAETGSVRKSMIGTGDRSEKIRTYNYPQNRVTDHRINFSIMELDRVMEGNIDPIIEALITEDQRRKMEES